MYIMYPIAYPTSCVLDYFLGGSHGTIYKKAGLKSLVSLHRSDDVDGLTADEVHIIASVLDLREKLVVDVMTPMEDVFTISLNSILDKELVHNILKNGYSRIPIKEETGDNYIGMLLVKNLISYDTDDNLPVSHFPISVLPETYPDTSCLDILNFFQEGKSKCCGLAEHRW
jgi:CBS domain containing-hemolysin-like protein